MKAFIKNVWLPILLSGAVLACCMISICFYHFLKYIQELKDAREAYEKKKSKRKSGQSGKAVYVGDVYEKEQLIQKTSLSRMPSLGSSTKSFFGEMGELQAVEDIKAYLHLAGIVIRCIYNYDKGYLQVSVIKILLYPLPAGIRDKHMLQYRLSFSVENSQTFESEPRPIRRQIPIHEVYRIYDPLFDVEDVEMEFDISIIDSAYNASFLQKVRYLLKPLNILCDESDGVSIPENHETGYDMDKICKVECIRKETEADKKPRILVSLCYKPTSGRISLTLIRGENFPTTAHKIRMQVTMLQTRYGSIRNFIGKVMENCKDPEIDDMFSLGISVSNIHTAALIISLQYGVGTISFFSTAEAKIGSLVSSESGEKHWKDMLSSVRTEVEMWHELKYDE